MDVREEQGEGGGLDGWLKVLSLEAVMATAMRVSSLHYCGQRVEVLAKGHLVLLEAGHRWTAPSEGTWRGTTSLSVAIGGEVGRHPRLFAEYVGDGSPETKNCNVRAEKGIGREWSGPAHYIDIADRHTDGPTS